MTPSLLRLLAPAALLVGAACASGRGPERITPLPVVVDPELQALAVRTQAMDPLPEVARRLPGGTVNLRGPVHAVVFPVSYGMRRPAWTERQIAYEMFGVVRDSLAGTAGAAARLARASEGRFRLNSSMVMPYLVDASATQLDIEAAFRDRTAMQALVRRALEPWPARTNLASYDNDGPDGLPSSVDDDGRIDLPILLIETDSLSAMATVPVNLAVRTGPGNRFTTVIGDVQVIATPRAVGLNVENLMPTLTVLRALGIGGSEVFRTSVPPGELETLTRMELGWLAPSTVTRSGSYSLGEGMALRLPILDVPNAAAHWVVEHGGNAIWITRAVSTGGRLVAAERQRVPVGGSFTVPLVREGGAGAPAAQITWSGTQVVVTAALGGSGR